MILGIGVLWACDKCGHRTHETYGEEEGNSPTIQITPAGWSREGAGIYCGHCSRARRSGRTAPRGRSPQRTESDSL